MTLSPANLPAALADLARTRGRGLKNLWARGSDAPIVVFESDDWGSQRVPSAAALRRLVAAGVLTGDNPYDRDTLENAGDIARLIETLDAVRGADGRPPVFNCYVNPANPDFEAIRLAGFERYYWETLPQTLARRGDAAAVMEAWRTGMAAGLLAPEYHGREHLNVPLWMRDLRRGAPLTRTGFSLDFYSTPEPSLPAPAKGYRAANFFESTETIPALAKILVSGSRAFEAVFERPATVFCPTNNIFHPALYGAVREAGCRGIIRHARNAQPDGRGGLKRTWGTAGVAEAGLACFGRNAIFEPALGYGAEHALAGIRSAFAWGVPAIVSTHRLNYVGGIDPAVRDRGLAALATLLRQIVSRWPDVRFATSASLVTGVMAA